jgi:hypothetical protein
MPQPGEGRTLNAVKADLRCSDVDLWQREITFRGKGSKDRIVRIGHHTARNWSGTSAPAPGTARPGGRSCGSEPTTGSR